MNGRTEAEDMEREYQRQSLRDHFAAAALTGLISLNCPGPNQRSPQELCELSYRWADAMLVERSRTGQKMAESDSFCAVCPERDNTSVGAAGAAPVTDRKSAAAHGACARSCSQPFDSAPATDQERFVRFQSAVMNWISEATCFFYDDALRTDDARDVVTDACSRCWDAFDRISYPTTNHCAAPAARGQNPTECSCLHREGCSTGNTHRGVEELGRPRRAHNPEIAGSNPAAPTDDAATGEPGGSVEFSPDSRTGQINRTPECESPRRECEESSLRDVARPDTKGKVAGGPEPKSPIDVEELLSELHFIAGSGDHVEYDIRRTACDAEHAIDRLRAWVNELQLSKVEIDALQHVVEDGKLVDLGDYGRLRSLLVRLRPKWEEEGEDAPPPHATPPQGSVQGEDSVPDSRSENEPVAWLIRGVLYDSGCEYEYVTNFKENSEAAAAQGGRVVPLYRQPQPTLTDAEREAVEWAAANAQEAVDKQLMGWRADAEMAATLRQLLERLG